MNTALRHFGLTETEIIRKDNEFYLTISKLAEVLQTSKNNLQKNIQMNRNEFGVLTMESNSTVTGLKESYILDEEQIYTLCMISRSKKAKEFRKVFAQMIKQIRKREYIHISEVDSLINRVNILAGIPKQKLTLYKKYRGLGLSRKHCCKAFDLPYSKMKEIDKILGYHKSRDVPWLSKYQFRKGLIDSGTKNNRNDSNLFSEVSYE